MLGVLIAILVVLVLILIGIIALVIFKVLDFIFNVCIMGTMYEFTGLTMEDSFDLGEEAFIKLEK